MLTQSAGEFAETVREQFLEERVEYFKELQRLLYVEALNDDAASKANLVRALCKCDPELGEKQVGPSLLSWLSGWQKVDHDCHEIQ